MAKLCFRYGVVDSGKSLLLLATATSYRNRGERVLIVAPEQVERSCEADIVIGERSLLDRKQIVGIKRILVRACHLLSVKVIEQLRQVVDELNIPVTCYGLRTDFRSQLFAGSQRLLELADSISALEATCAFCNQPATMNMKVARASATLVGPQIGMGIGESLLPSCSFCYFKRVQSEMERSVGFAGKKSLTKQRSAEDDNVFVISQALHDSFNAETNQEWAELAAHMRAARASANEIHLDKLQISEAPVSAHITSA